MRPKLMIGAVLALLMLPVSAAWAQESMFGITWNISVPIDSTEKWVGQTSYRGIGIEYRKFTDYNFTGSIGFSAAWHVFDDRSFQTVNLEGEDINGTVSGDNFRWINSVPLMLGLHYYLGDQYSGTRLYLGVNGGTMYIERRADLGIFTTATDAWHWAIAPEVGLGFAFDESHLYMNLKYYYAFEVDEQHPEETYLGFAVGFAYTIY